MWLLREINEKGTIFVIPSQLSFSLEPEAEGLWAGEVCIGLASADDEAWLAAGESESEKLREINFQDYKITQIMLSAIF